MYRIVEFGLGGKFSAWLVLKDFSRSRRCRRARQFLPRVASAQNITVDGRFSPAQTLVGPNYSITANIGKQVGSNLLHSFGQFGLATGESAGFSVPLRSAT